LSILSGLGARTPELGKKGTPWRKRSGKGRKTSPHRRRLAKLFCKLKKGAEKRQSGKTRTGKKGSIHFRKGRANQPRKSDLSASYLILHKKRGREKKTCTSTFRRGEKREEVAYIPSRRSLDERFAQGEIYLLSDYWRKRSWRTFEKEKKAFREKRGHSRKKCSS